VWQVIERRDDRPAVHLALIDLLGAVIKAGGIAEPEWVTTADGRRAFAITDYFVEGQRVSNWITAGVVKHHRTIGTMVGGLLAARFVLTGLTEWRPDEDQLAVHPEWRETELVRPMFLLISAHKPSERAH
jgi:hypothetical protein